MTIIYKQEIETRVCCEACGEITASFFDCPVCKKRAHTDAYAVMFKIDEPDRFFKCGECGAKFRMIDAPDDDPQWILEWFVSADDSEEARK